MGRATKAELLWAYAITREEFFKRLNEKSPLKKEDLDYLQDLLFNIINKDEADIYDPKRNEELERIVEKYLHPMDDFISLTDIAKRFDSENPSYLIQSWLRSRNTVVFLGEWERINNSKFDESAFQQLLTEIRSPSYTLTPTKWIKTVNATGLTSKRGKNGRTMAHPLIACDFEMWNDIKFKYYILQFFASGKNCDSLKERK